jgi:hypothetical protein
MRMGEETFLIIKYEVLQMRRSGVGRGLRGVPKRCGPNCGGGARFRKRPESRMPATVENQKVKVSFQNRQAKRAIWSLSIHLYP